MKRATTLFRFSGLSLVLVNISWSVLMNGSFFPWAAQVPAARPVYREGYSLLRLEFKCLSCLLSISRLSREHFSFPLSNIFSAIFLILESFDILKAYLKKS